MSSQELLGPLITALGRLPGIGRRSAERMAIRLIREPDRLLRPLAGVLQEADQRACLCDLCGSVTARDVTPCRLCRDPGRDDTLLCVVEDPSDIAMIERSGGFRGRYHALMGKLSPMRGDGPLELRVESLLKRVAEGHVGEVVLALSTDVEGDSTAAFLAEKLHALGVGVSRLAFGLPAGSGIGYSDPVTLARAIKGRQEA